MRSAKLSLSLLTSALFLNASACGITDPPPCLGDEVHYTVEPGVSYVKVGEIFTLRAERLTCNRQVRTREYPQWISLDPSVARVDAKTGRVTAVGTGSAQINGDFPDRFVYSASVNVD